MSDLRTTQTGDEGLADWVAGLRQLLETRLGHALSETQLARAVDATRQIARSCGAASPDELLAELASLPIHAPLLQALVHQVTNKESYFFRDPPAMESLRYRVLPRLIGAARARRSLHVWSAGCAGGEELYSLAILLEELLPTGEAWSVSLVGTDVDAGALATARRAEYGEWSLRTAEPSTRVRYFDQIDGSARYRVKPRYRERVQLELHNLADPQAAPPSPGMFDLIVCRNVTIYFGEAARDHLTHKFLAALHPDGAWITGPSDPIPLRPGLSASVHPGLVQLRPIARVAPGRTPSWAPDEGASRRGPENRRPTLASTQPPPLPVEPRSGLPAVRPTRPSNPQQDSSPEPRLDPEFDESVEGDPRVARARRLADEGRIAQAAALLDTVLATAADVGAFLLRAALHESTPGEESKAREAYARALYLEPQSAETHARLGLLLERIGDARGAARSFRNAIAISLRSKENDDHRAPASDRVRHIGLGGLSRLSRRGSP